MPLNHSFRMLFCNLKLVIKVTLLITIILLLAFTALYSVIMPVVSDIKDIIYSVDVEANDFVNHPFLTLKTYFIDEFIEYFQAKDWTGTIGITFALYFLIRFCMTIPQLPLTKVLYNKMTTGYDVGLFNAFVSTGFQNLLLSLILAFVTSIVNIALIVGFIALVVVCITAKAYLALPFIVLAFLALYSAKSCLLSQIMPEICASETKNIFVGMKNAVKGTVLKFRKNFLCFFALNVITFTVFTTTALPTLGAVTVIALPVFIVLRALLSLTLNFSYHRRKYFVDNGMTVYTPEKLF